MRTSAPPFTAAELVFTPMTIADMAAVLQIEQASYRAPWTEQLFREDLERNWAYIDLVRRRPNSDSDSASDSDILGFCNYWLVRDEVHLLNLVVHPTYRRRGLGRHLMDHLLAFAEGHHCSFITLEVRRSNDAAQALYRGYQFQVVGVRPKYYADNGEDAVVMTRFCTE